MRKKGIILAIVVVIALAIVLLLFTLVRKQNESEDETAIKAVALDYIEGWYEGNTDRMDRALDENLVKRLIKNNTCETLDKDTMLKYTRQGGGRSYSGEQKNDIKILDISGNIATVACYSAEYVDYLHLGKTDGEWRIINVLWCYKEDAPK